MSNIFGSCQIFSKVVRSCHTLKKLSDAVGSYQKLSDAVAVRSCWRLLVPGGVGRCETLSDAVRSCRKFCQKLSEACQTEKLVTTSEACQKLVWQLSQWCRKLSESVRQRPEAVRHGLKLSDPVKGCLRRSLTARSCRRLSEVCQVLSNACQKILEAVRTCQKLVRSCQMLVKSCQKQSGTVGGCQRLALSEACRKLAGSL